MSNRQSGDPGRVFEVGGGTYCGFGTTRKVPDERGDIKTIAGTDQLRPLKGKDFERSFRGAEAVRSTWHSSGNPHLFSGDGHRAIFGVMGSGKTRKDIICNMLRTPLRSRIVTDPKGEIAAHCAVELERQGCRVFVLDPLEQIKTHYPLLYKNHTKLFTSRRYNPVAALDPAGRTFIEDVDTLAMSIVPPDGDPGSKMNYWSEAAQALVSGCLLYCRLAEKGITDSLPAVWALLGVKPETLAGRLDDAVKKFGEAWPAIEVALSEFTEHNPKSNELGAIRRQAKTKMKWLSSPLVRHDLSCKTNDIDFAELKTIPTVVFLILPLERLETHGAWLRLMITAAMIPLLRSAEAAAVPVDFYLDEMAAIGRLAIVEQNITVLRGLGVQLHTYWQHINQMKNLYGNAHHNFLATADVKICFRCNDHDTAEYFSQLAGERHYEHKTVSVSTVHGDSTNWGKSKSGDTKGKSSGGGDSWTRSTNESTQLMKERVITHQQLYGLHQDEAMLVKQRGRWERAIYYQPEVVPWAQTAILRARSEIEGRPIVVPESTEEREKGWLKWLPL